MPNNYRKSFNFRNGVQVDDDNFVVNPNGFVGIGTTLPTEYLLNVYGSSRFVGLVTTQNLNVSGITTVGFLTARQGISVSGAVTATTYFGDGSLLRNIIGFSTEAWIVNASRTGLSTTFNVGIGTTVLDSYALLIGSDPLVSNGISFEKQSGNIRSTGILTARSFVGFGSDITEINATYITKGTLDNNRLPNIRVGIITATTTFFGTLTGIASTALSLSGNPDISVSNITASNYNSSGILTTSNAYINNINSGFSTCGVSTVLYTLNIAPLGSIGVGTNNPNADIHIRDSNNGASMQLTSDGSNEAYVAIGRSVTRTGNNGELRFGNSNISQRYSTPSSLDIINYGNGNFNHYLNFGSAGIGSTGSFNWIPGQTANSPTMTLTYGGNLGIGITLPVHSLHVVGTSTVSGNSYVGGNLYVNNDLTITGAINPLGGFSAGAVITATFQGPLQGNVNSTGLSTFQNINVTGVASFSSLLLPNGTIGIGSTNIVNGNKLQINNGSNRFFVDNLGGVGVKTTVICYPPAGTGGYDVGVDCSSSLGFFDGVGIGTTVPNCFLDFSCAGENHPSLLSYFMFMLPPSVSTSVRNSAPVNPYGVEGAVIYNTTSKRLELYKNGGWCGIATVP